MKVLTCHGNKFRTVLPNLTYGLTKEELVSFAEKQSTPQVDPTSRPHKSTRQVNPTSRPDKSTRQVNPTSRLRLMANSESRAKLLVALLAGGELSRRELMEQIGLRDRESFYALYILPSLDIGFIEYTIPDKPNSRLQKYRITAKGRAELRRGTR